MEYATFEKLHTALLSNKGKIIHQIWFGTIPNKKAAKKAFKGLSKYRDTWLNKNPDWHYHCWNLIDCLNLVKIHFPEHLEMYNAYEYPIQKCDCIRYCILYMYGGLYADMDYCCNKPWNEVLKNYPSDLYITETPNKMHNEVHISNSLMYSKPEHPFWKHMLIEMEQNRTVPIYYSKHMAIMYTTGPGIINRVFHKYKTKYNLDYYPYKLFHPFGITTELRVNSDSNIYAYHLQKGCWNTLDTNIFNFFYKEHKIILFIIMVLGIFPIILNNFIRKK